MAEVRIDNREGDRIQAIEFALTPFGHSVQKAQLEVSDICIGREVGIEIKATGDFVASIVDGRLFPQAVELRDQFDKPFIVVLGSLKDCMFARYGVNHNAVLGAVTSLLMHHGVNVVFLGKLPLTDFLISLIGKVDKPSSYSYTPVRRGATPAERGAAMLVQLPDIGAKKAQAIIEKYDSPMEALNDYENWSEIDGIGQTTIEKLAEVLGPAGGTPATQEPQRDRRAEPRH